MPLASGGSEPQHLRPLIGRRTEWRALNALVDAEPIGAGIFNASVLLLHPFGNERN